MTMFNNYVKWRYNTGIYFCLTMFNPANDKGVLTIYWEILGVSPWLAGIIRKTASLEMARTSIGWVEICVHISIIHNMYTYMYYI